jgi:ABC-type multidrug transport system ATPase subunit
LGQGASGAGKTTLLNALAKQLSVGVVTGDILLDGQMLPPGFERNCGYVLQQDLHVETSTVREALQFSALLRQPRSTMKEEKLGFVEEVIKILGMQEFADAVVGVPGQGLDTRQRKLLSIGVELAAKPSVLLFLDEPTTGLDSHSAYGVVAFLRLLANNGMPILCTIHQPSAAIFQQFDRLLLLVKGGRTAYFGDIGKSSQTVVEYFEGNGARKCSPKENPAEYLIETASQDAADWPSIWQASSENEKFRAELNLLQQTEATVDNSLSINPEENPRTPSAESREFALPLHEQLYHVSFRVYQQYWRSPQYIWAKITLACVSSM